MTTRSRPSCRPARPRRRSARWSASGAYFDALEEEFKISQTEGVGQREPDLGFAWAAHQWASGKGLDEVLREADMPAGDFVRWCKQVIDVLGQIAAASPSVSGAGDGNTVAKNARKAVDALRRGVVAYSSVG